MMRSAGRFPLVILVSAFLCSAPAAHAFGEYFDARVTVTKRIGAVDSSASATLFTFFGEYAANQEIRGTHTMTDSFGATVAGGFWARLGEYSGYIRTFAEEGTCYRARIVAFHVNGTAGADSGSHEVCFPFHSPECGHCGPGTGNPCSQIVSGEAE